MKYIIILITSLFLVSNASAQEVNLKQICKNELYALSNVKMLLNSKAGDIDEETREDLNKTILDIAKLYHYLDCREELKGDG